MLPSLLRLSRSSCSYSVKERAAKGLILSQLRQLEHNNSRLLRAVEEGYKASRVLDSEVRCRHGPKSLRLTEILKESHAVGKQRKALLPLEEAWQKWSDKKNVSTSVPVGEFDSVDIFRSSMTPFLCSTILTLPRSLKRSPLKF